MNILHLCLWHMTLLAADNKIHHSYISKSKQRVAQKLQVLEKEVAFYFFFLFCELALLVWLKSVSKALGQCSQSAVHCLFCENPAALWGSGVLLNLLHWTESHIHSYELQSLPWLPNLDRISLEIHPPRNLSDPPCVGKSVHILRLVLLKYTLKGKSLVCPGCRFKVFCSYTVNLLTLRVSVYIFLIILHVQNTYFSYYQDGHFC